MRSSNGALSTRGFFPNETGCFGLATSFPRGLLGTLSRDDDDGCENVGKKMNLRSFKLSRVYLDLLNMSNAGDLSWS